MTATFGTSKVADKFRKMAEGLTAEAERKRLPGLDNTPKRAMQAAGRRIDADHYNRMAAGLLALADLHDAGQVPAVLAEVKTKDDVRKLTRNRLDHPSYYTLIDSREYADTSPAGRALQKLIADHSDPAALAERKRLAEIAEAEARVRFQNIPGFFPTPPAVVERMVELADLRPGLLVLEPSAGKGDIADAAVKAGAAVVVAEVMPVLCRILGLKGHKFTGSDFLALPWPESDRAYDRVLMNPPFEKGAEMAHVEHAYGFLKPGGRLVAVMSSGPFSRSGNKETEFRGWLQRVEAEVHALPADAFKSAFNPTGVQTRLVVIDRPDYKGGPTAAGGDLFAGC